MSKAPRFRTHHLGVAVADMDRALEWYREAFGLTLLSGPTDDPGQQVRVALLGDRDNTIAPSLELVAPLSERSPIARYLRGDSSAYHVCYEVNDLAEAIAWLRERKALLVSGPFPALALGGRPLAWMYLPDRHLVELIQRHV